MDTVFRGTFIATGGMNKIANVLLPAEYIHNDGDICNRFGDNVAAWIHWNDSGGNDGDPFQSIVAVEFVTRQ